MLWRPKMREGARGFGLLMIFLFVFLTVTTRAGTLPPIQTVFVILMENNNWSNIKGNPAAPYINSLLPRASHCEQYTSVYHPSLPNYLWLEAGTNFGISDDNDPSSDHQSTTNHLVTLLNNAGITWKAYEEGIPGTNVPLLNTSSGYAVRHDPFAYFDDITGTNNPNYAYGIAHIRPFTELVGDLASNHVARYNFITPNVCDDMHDTCAPLNNSVLQGDNWLSNNLPIILGSEAYLNGGAVFITWDESEGGTYPIGMIVLSPYARGSGYSNTVSYTHSSTLRTMQEIFGVTPLLRDAANATDLSDLFMPPQTPPAGLEITNFSASANGVKMNVVGVNPGSTNVVQLSTDLAHWNPVSTNVATTSSFAYTNSSPANIGKTFYRVIEMR
ncbi:MAG TPA: alkaline phosphatase family protein [Verrucomicrobiae bacterium]|nr:alkaline phosphatase family protein [Verrucomicrobiae bacterium]